MPLHRTINIWTLLLATYSLLLVGGSLYPFAGWHGQALNLSFLWAPWPKSITRTDLVTNVLAYAPFGLFLACTLFPHRFTFLRWLLVCACTAVFSTLMECGQVWEPYRVASNVDILTNTLGGAAGAALTPFFSRHSRFLVAFIALRRHWFRSGWITHAGLILLGLWVLSQLSLQAPALVAGDLHTGFRPFWESPHAHEFRPLTTLIFALEMVSLNLFFGFLLRPHHVKMPSLIALTVAAILLKIIAAALLIKLSLLHRLLSLEVLLGLGMGSILAWALIYARPAAALFPSTVTALCLFILSKLLHGVPFTTATGHAPDLAMRPELLLNITGIAYLVAEAWPYLALGCTLALSDEAHST